MFNVLTVLDFDSQQDQVEEAREGWDDEETLREGNERISEIEIEK